MNKKLFSLALVLLILTAMAVLLPSCGTSNSLSGKYLCESSGEYLEFYDKREVALYVPDTYPIEGFYKVKGNIISIDFDAGGYYSELKFALSKDKNTITLNTGTQSEIVMIKEKETEVFKLPWWGWVIIVVIGFNIISAIYKKLTKRNLAEDIEGITDPDND